MNYVDIFNGFIRSGDTVCEVFYGNRPDLIPLLSLVVKKKGTVFAIDKYSSTELINNSELFMQKLPFKNVIFLKSKIPPLPESIERSSINAFICREFMWAYAAEHGTPVNLGLVPIVTMHSINDALKHKGFILFFDPISYTNIYLERSIKR